MASTELTLLTIREASRLLSNRSISAVELLAATLNRIEQTEPHVHAYASVLEEQAQAEAASADTALRHGRWLGPLHGIPIGIKDLCYTEGAPTEAGSKVMKGFIPAFDATVVRRIRAAGGVIIGKTVTHEFAYGRNPIPTRNAWNQQYISGGSSAGSAVSVAVGSAFGAIGTDTAGSIRLPASLNGIVALKPTFGRVSRYGVFPMSSSLDTVGPMTRSVEDCATMLGAVAGFDELDATTLDESVPDYVKHLGGGIAGLRFGIERNYFFYHGVSGDVRTRVNQAVLELERLGGTLVDVSIPELEFTTAIGMPILLADTSTWHRQLLRQRPQDYDRGTRLVLELGELVPATHYITAQRARTVLQSRVRDMFESQQLSALVMPTLPLPAVLGDPMASDTFYGLDESVSQSAMSAYIHHTFAANVLGLPALTIPCGFSTDGLPVGLQLLGRPFGEHLLFQAGSAYEASQTWHLHHPAL
jgi:aspartyl-tRNA(Asn)/glutamyl-tRNA(Gln) amidotransferase subunit A